METREWRPIDLARTAHVSVPTVRSYEDLGFLPPARRTSGGHRRYTERHVAAMRTARILIAGYGWSFALTAMRAIHRGESDSAFAIGNGRHANLDQRRLELDRVLEALETVTAIEEGVTSWRRGGVRIGEAARWAKVPPSALRYWESQGLLFPSRDTGNGFRIYDERQLRNLAIVAMLRDAGHGADIIRTVLAELNAGRPEQAISAMRKRREDLSEATRACARATAALWSYAEQID